MFGVFVDMNCIFQKKHSCISRLETGIESKNYQCLANEQRKTMILKTWSKQTNAAQKEAATSESKNPAPVDQVVSRISSINRIYWQEPCGSSRLKRLPTHETNQQSLGWCAVKSVKASHILGPKINLKYPDVPLSVCVHTESFKRLIASVWCGNCHCYATVRTDNSGTAASTMAVHPSPSLSCYSYTSVATLQ